MLIFGDKFYDKTALAIYIEKEGKYLYLKKPYKDENKEYRMDLTNGQFERINHYKTTGTKITPVKVANITGWFTGCSLFCDDEKFCKVITYSKYLRDNRKFKSSVRFIQSLTHYKVRHYEAWLSLGIDIVDIRESVDRCIGNSSGYYNYRSTTDNYISWEPSEFPKNTLKYIRKNFKELTGDAISKMYQLTYDGYDINLIGELLERTESTPQYREFFRVKEYSWRVDSEKYNIFDLSQNKNFSTLGMMQTIIECISEYNLNIDAFLKFCLRMYNVEGLTAADLFTTRHYKDYLNMERKLKNHQMRKMDKYPQHFLTTFHITKKEYAIRKQEFDEEDFKMQCDKFRDLEQKFKKYSIVVPERISDIEEEADELKHCVRMYIPQVVQGKTLICFLRDNENLDIPLVTIEVKEGFVTQAYGLHDSKPSEEQLDVLRSWAKKHSLKLSWAWD